MAVCRSVGRSGGMNLYAYCYGNPINLSDPDGLKPGDPFVTPDDAAIDALNWIKKSGGNGLGTELGGVIYKGKGGCYHASNPHSGVQGAGGGNGAVRPQDVIPSLLLDGIRIADIVAGYHYHYEGLMGDFSPEDKD